MLRKFLRIVLKHNIYEVNLGVFALFRRSSSIDAAPTGLKGLGQTRFYTDTVATRLKRVLEVPAENPVRLGNRTYQTWNERIRFGWECRSHESTVRRFPCGIPRGEYTAKPNLPACGLKRLFFLNPIYGESLGLCCLSAFW